MNFARWYAQFRGSAVFLYGLSGFIGLWLLMHALFGWWDKDLALINLVLSSEASVSLAFFSLLNEQQDKRFEDMLTQVDTVADRILEVVTNNNKENDGSESKQG